MRIVKEFVVTLLALLLPLESLAASRDKPVVLSSFDYPPFMEVVNGQPSGIAVEAVTEAFRRMHIPVKIAFYPLGRNFAMLDAGETDGMFTVKKTPERLAAYAFSKEALQTQEYVIFVPMDSKLIFHGKLEELAEHVIGVVPNTSYGPVFDAAVRDGVLWHLDPAPNHESNFKKLLFHRVDAVVCSKIVGLSILKRLNMDGQAKIIGPVLDTTHSYVMFGKAVDPSLVQSFDKAVANMRSDGTLARIINTYTR